MKYASNISLEWELNPYQCAVEPEVGSRVYYISGEITARIRRKYHSIDINVSFSSNSKLILKCLKQMKHNIFSMIDGTMVIHNML